MPARSPRPPYLFSTAAALLAAALVVSSPVSSAVRHKPRRPATRRPAATAPAGPWRVVDVRAPRIHEDAWEPRHPMLRDPLDPNRVPGLAGSVARVRTDADHHPGLFVEDESTHRVRRLGGGRWISQPRWSADGEWLAGTVWRSPASPWQPCVVRVRDGRVTEVARDLPASSVRWAPDGRHIAIAATLPELDRGVLAVMDVASGEVAFLDTLPVLAELEMSWSPDSRTLAHTRPVSVGDGQEQLQTDLAVANLDGERMTLFTARGQVVREPRFVDGRRVRCVVTSARTAPRPADERLVVFEHR